MEKPRVFLSYAFNDREIAYAIKNRLYENDILVYSDETHLDFSESLIVKIRSQLVASDYFVIILSESSLNSEWVKFDLEYAINKDLRQRGINLIPFKIQPLQLPDYISSLSLIDATRNIESGINKLVSLLQTAPLIKFDNLTPIELEALTSDLLKTYGFHSIKNSRFAADPGYDFSAIYEDKDPFGRNQITEWIIEVKATKSKTDTSVLQQFLGALSLRSEHTKGLFMTFSQLTSPALEWLEHMRKSGKPEITVLEGPEIKKLILAKPRLIKKYFEKVGGK